jgi:copper chaperone CopZ
MFTSDFSPPARALHQMILSSLWLEIDAGVSNLSSVEFTGKPPSRFGAAARDRLWTCLTAALGHSVTFNRPHCIDCPFPCLAGSGSGHHHQGCTDRIVEHTLDLAIVGSSTFAQDSQTRLSMYHLTVEDMTCGHCAATVEKAVKAADLKANVAVNLEAKTASIESRIGSDVFTLRLKTLVTGVLQEVLLQPRRLISKATETIETQL